MDETPYPNGLADCMALARITDPQLAAAAGTTKQQIFKLRRGERKMTVQWAKRLAPYLEVTWQELIEGPAPPTVRSRVELLEIFDVVDEQGKEMLLRLARSLRADSAPQGDGQGKPVLRSRRTVTLRDGASSRH
jgi:transcriptional regulator with XRE-family HTH domain